MSALFAKAHEIVAAKMEEHLLDAAFQDAGSKELQAC